LLFLNHRLCIFETKSPIWLRMLDFLEFGRLGLTTQAHAGEKYATYRFHCSVEMQLMK
jgi:hypothetical protein